MTDGNLLLKYRQKTVKEVLAELKSSEQGLTLVEAKIRLLRDGSNVLEVQQKRSVIKIFLSQLSSPLVLILVVASLIAGWLGDITSTVIIIGIILISACLAFYQEYKSERAVDDLRKRVGLKASVIRQGQPQLIPTTELVVGDIVVLDLGKVVPADLFLFQTDKLLINEAILTGESFPAEKMVSSQATAGDQAAAPNNSALMGTHVVQGSGRGVVVATAKNTALGNTAHLLQVKPQATEFQKGIKDFGVLLMKVILLFTLVVLLVLTVIKEQPLGESFLFALAIAVGISPELLPVIITINLSRGAKKMTAKQVIVKRLMSIEDLGNADILCTDKTGTLTKGKIVLHSYSNLEGKTDEQILDYGLLCNALTIVKEVVGNPLDEAIVNYAKENKLTADLASYRLVDDLAFDFNRRRMSVIVQSRAQRLLICKGALEETLRVCQRVKINGTVCNLSPHLVDISKKLVALQQQGLRLLLVAAKEISTKEKYTVSDEEDLVLLGYLAFVDQPKESAKESLMILEKLGVEIKVLTGDSEPAARYLCQQLNFPVSGVYGGAELIELSDNELKKVVQEVNIFVKVSPESKLKIIKALKDLGHTVAFLGDGVNDAPALRAADVGISVDSAVDVAKEAADVILLKKSLKVIADGIIEGRKTFGNTLKYIFSTINSNFGNMFSVAGAAIILPFIPMLPTQVLLLNFLSDLPMLALASDRVDDEYLHKPKHWDVKVIKKFMIYFGTLSSVFDFITFGVLLFIFRTNTALFQTGWFWESFLTEVVIVYIIRTKKWFWQSLPSRLLFFAGVVTTILVLLFIYTSWGTFFGLTPLPAEVLWSLVGITIVYFSVVEVSKKVFYKKFTI